MQHAYVQGEHAQFVETEPKVWKIQLLGTTPAPATGDTFTYTWSRGARAGESKTYTVVSVDGRFITQKAQRGKVSKATTAPTTAQTTARTTAPTPAPTTAQTNPAPGQDEVWLLIDELQTACDRLTAELQATIVERDELAELVQLIARATTQYLAATTTTARTTAQTTAPTPAPTPPAPPAPPAPALHPVARGESCGCDTGAPAHRVHPQASAIASTGTHRTMIYVCGTCATLPAEQVIAAITY